MFAVHQLPQVAECVWGHKVCWPPCFLPQLR